MTSTYVCLWKPCLDRLAAVFLLLLTAPVLAFIALVVRVRLGPGVIFRQQRIGRHGVAFDVLKFRTMLPDRRRADMPVPFPDRRRTHKSGADPRHTPVGRFLRRWSLDELPQFFNVARGQMSLIGPRPALASVVARYQPWQHEQHDVGPVPPATPARPRQQHRPGPASNTGPAPPATPAPTAPPATWNQPASQPRNRRNVTTRRL